MHGREVSTHGVPEKDCIAGQGSRHINMRALWEGATRLNRGALQIWYLTGQAAQHIGLCMQGGVNIEGARGALSSGCGEHAWGHQKCIKQGAAPCFEPTRTVGRKLLHA